MVGKKGRSGRKPGRKQTPTNVFVRQLTSLIDFWLSGAPIRIGDQFLQWPSERRYTVPPRVMKALTEFAVRHTVKLFIKDEQYSRALPMSPKNLAALAQRYRDRINISRGLEEVRRKCPDGSLRRRRRPF
jgi:hypothetical protein